MEKNIGVHCDDGTFATALMIPGNDSVELPSKIAVHHKTAGRQALKRRPAFYFADLLPEEGVFAVDWEIFESGLGAQIRSCSR